MRTGHNPFINFNFVIENPLTFVRFFRFYANIRLNHIMEIHTIWSNRDYVYDEDVTITVTHNTMRAGWMCVCGKSCGQETTKTTKDNTLPFWHVISDEVVPVSLNLISKLVGVR